MVAAGWSEAQKRAYVLADNKLAQNAGWDDDLLGLELGDLRTDGFDLALVGFNEDELAELLTQKTQGLTDPDDAPEPPDNPVTQAGDVWVLGNHRIICGDATNPDDVARVLGGVKPHLMVTDPPYGVEYEIAAPSRPPKRHRLQVDTLRRLPDLPRGERLDAARCEGATEPANTEDHHAT